MTVVWQEMQDPVIQATGTQLGGSPLGAQPNWNGLELINIWNNNPRPITNQPLVFTIL